jgi:hypothetical protein
MTDDKDAAQKEAEMREHEREAREREAAERDDEAEEGKPAPPGSANIGGGVSGGT